MHRGFAKILSGLSCLVAILAFAAIANAQFRAALQGSVSDASGAVIPGAAVTLTSNETQRTQQTVTSDDGFYRFSNLAPGSYSLTVEQSNFKKQVIENVTVTAENVQGLDVALAAGGVSETVTVNSDESAPLETEDANIRNTITRQEILRLPQAGRDPYELARLTPGVFGDAARGGNGGAVGLPNSTGPGGSNNSIFQTENQVQISANGQRTSANNFQIDGVSVNSQTFGGAAVITPSQESVKEVTITSSSYSAEDGRNSGALVKVVSQNGTNDFHGSAFFKYNDPEFNAFNKYPAPQRVENRLRQFGGSLGGPLPFLNFGDGGPFAISGKDKLFFFFAYEGLRTGSNNTYRAYIETPEYRNSVIALRPNGVTAQVFRTANIEPQIASLIPITCAAAGFGSDRCREVNGRLDLGSVTGAQNVYLPLGGGVGRADIGGGFDGVPDVQYANLFNPNSFSGNQYFTRIDYNATAKDSIAVSTFFTPTLNSGTDTAGRSRPIGDIISDRLSFSVAAIYNRTISQTMFNQARLNYSGFSFNEVESNPIGNFGIPRIEVEGLPFDRIRFGAPQGENTPGILSEKSVDFSDTFNWVLGNHALKFGTQLRFDFNNNSIIGGARPVFSFVGLFNLANDTPIFEGINADPTTGQPADASRKYRTNDYAFFVQDDWKVKRNLTLNLGLRYEYFQPIKDELNQQSNIVFGPNGLADARIAVVDQLFTPDRNNFGPQFGFAYSPGFLDDKAVLRGGFGIGYNRIPNVVFINSRGNPPFFSRFGICCGTAATDFGSPFVNGQILYALGRSNSPNSYPANPNLGGGINPATGAPFNGSVEIYGSTEEQPNAQSYRYSLEMQYQLPSRLIATIGYQGSRTNNLIRLVNQNYIFAQTNPAFNAVYLPTPDVKSRYNALLATVERRFANGFQIQANYRFAKSMDNLSNEGPGFVTNQTYPVDNDTEYGPSDFDVRHNLNVFGLWDLPIFRKRNDLVGTLLGGWQISGIVTWHTGFPWTPVVGGPGIRSASGAEFGPFRPTAYSGGNGNDTSNETFLNGNGNFTGSFIPGTNCLNTPGGCNSIFLTTLNRNASGQATFLLNPPGIGRNSFRGPRYFSTDLTVSKRFNLPEGFRIGENTGLDLRANFFNVFNNLNLLPFGFASDSTRINNGDQPNLNFGRATGGLAGRVIELQARFSF